MLTLASGALAQAPADDAWRVTVVPDLMGGSMNGTTAVAGQEATVDRSASDIFGNLQFGAMGLFTAAKGNWGVGGDVIWMSLGANGTAPGPLARVTVNIARQASIEVGYRWLDIDYESGEGTTLFKYDVLTQGPVVGFAFRF